MQQNTLRHLLYKSGPTMSLMNFKGFVISKLNLPTGYGKIGFIFGDSLPSLFLNFSDSYLGNSSKLKLTHP